MRNVKKTVIELFRDDMKFSAAHFTIFSDKKRERLHGHNFHVYVSIESQVNENGLSFDYREFRKKIISICQFLNEQCLMPSHSKYLSIKEEGSHYRIIFDSRDFLFPKEDVLLMPLENITVEELSEWFLKKLLMDLDSFLFKQILSIKVKISTTPGQYGSAVKELRCEL